jgi:lipopolysaccharide export system protein LptA
VTNPATRQRMSLRLATSVLVVLLSGSPAVHALETDEDQPVYLEADSVLVDEQKSQSIYTGHVQVRQGSMELLADQVRVHHYPDRRPEHITAVGSPARYRQAIKRQKEDVHGEALHIEYDADKGELTLVGKAVLYQGKDTFRNDRIIYDRATGEVKAGAIAQGKERVRIVVNPAQHQRDQSQESHRPHPK